LRHTVEVDSSSLHRPDVTARVQRETKARCSVVPGWEDTS
jgi:hypothetical protein